MRFLFAIVPAVIVLTATTALADAAKEARRAVRRSLRKTELCIVDPSADAKTAKNKEAGDLTFLRKCSKRGLYKANLEDLKQEIFINTETIINNEIKGEKGDPGAQGPQGPQGVPGPAGPQGAPGTAAFTNGYWQQAAPAMPPVGVPGVFMVGAGLNCNAANEVAVGPIVTHAMGPAATVGDIVPAMGMVNGANVPIGYAATLVATVVAPGGLPIGPTGMQIGFWCIPQ